MKLLNYKFIKKWYKKYYDILNLFILIDFIILVILFISPNENVAIFSVIYFIIFFVYLIYFCTIRGDLREIDKDTLKCIEDKINSKKFKYFDNIGVICFNDFFVYMTHGFKIVKYDELDKCYLIRNHKKYDRRYIDLLFKNGNEKWIFIKGNDKSLKESNEFLKYIEDKDYKSII